MEHDYPQFGSTGRYYSDPAGFRAQGQGTSADSKEEATVRRILKTYQKDLQKRVELSCKQWNQTLRDHIKNEMALRLIVGDERQSVPVRVVDGLPLPFWMLVRELPEEIWQLWELLLNRSKLLRTVDGLQLVKSEYDSISNWEPMKSRMSSREELESVLTFIQDLLKEIKKYELFEKIRGINEDILGAYFFRVPKIEIYWMVIGIVCSMLGVSVEALTIVVLTHELAHAYSHLGLDIDGVQWETEAFAKADLNIVEGLAQYYTASICEALSPRNPDAKEAFEQLLTGQPAPYKVHQEWCADDERAGEIVRYGLIQCRSKDIIAYHEFLQRLEEARQRIGPRQKQRKPQPDAS